MTDESEPSVLGSLPRSRPQRRSDRRGARPVADAAEQPATNQPPKRATNQPPKRATNQPPKRATNQPPKRAAEQKPQPEPEEPRRTTCAASLSDGAELVGTVVKATAELAEIGLTLAARALRSTLSRLPRP